MAKNAKRKSKVLTPEEKRIVTGKHFIMDHFKQKDVNDGVKDAISKFHENHRLLDERAFYPPHSSRKESPEYAKVHKLLVDKMDLPCLVCGVRKSTINKPSENPFGAKHLETHHHVIEWALANAVDLEKFNKIIRPSLMRRHPKKPEYKKDFTVQQVADWVDHSEDNLWVLCDIHHRHKWLGIHEISYPIWGPQDLYNPRFEGQVKAALSKNPGNPKK